MSIANHQTTSTADVALVLPPSSPVPLLQNGDHLTRAEFERRYEAMPHIKKAELVEGIVYMPSPVRLVQHAHPHAHIVTWIGYYTSKTPHIVVGDNGTSRLDEDNEPQPDVMLLIPPWAGGNAVVDDDGFVSRAPELVCEVAASSVSIDMHAKLRAYRRNGVKEYLVWRTEERAVEWFELIEGKYGAMQADESSRLRSKVFPGLWLEVAALLAGDLPKVFAAVEAGTATDEHKAFVTRLNEMAVRQAAANG